jgi:hypothetical protein
MSNISNFQDLNLTLSATKAPVKGLSSAKMIRTTLMVITQKRSSKMISKEYSLRIRGKLFRMLTNPYQMQAKIRSVQILR